MQVTGLRLLVDAAAAWIDLYQERAVQSLERVRSASLFPRFSSQEKIHSLL